MTIPTDNIPDEQQLLSKTRKKKIAENLQKLGEELSLLAVSELKQLDLDPDLFKALVEAKSITANVAARRHRQYIGSLMRQVDPEPILAELERIKAAPAGLFSPTSETDMQADIKIQAVLDKLLVFDNDAMETLLSAAPDLERQHLRQLIRNAGKDLSNNKKQSKSLKALKDIIISNTI